MDLGKYARNQWDRIGAWLCVLGGIVTLIVGYVGVSGTLDTGKQMPYIVSGGMFGLFLLGLGALLWLSADLRDEWRKLDAIDRHLLETGTMPPPAPTDAASARKEPVNPDRASPDPANADAPNADAPNADAADADAANPDAANPESVSREPVNPGPVNPERASR